MKTTITEAGNKTLVTISGEVATDMCEEFKASLAPLYDRGGIIILMDLSELTYIASNGLRVLLSLAKDQLASGGSVKVTALTPLVYEVFNLTGFSKIFLLPDTKVVM